MKNKIQFGTPVLNGSIDVPVRTTAIILVFLGIGILVAGLDMLSE